MSVEPAINMTDHPSSAKKTNKPSAPAEPDHCRICRSEGTPEEPLYHPCKCSGSIKFVHQDCLMEWLQHSQKKYCELCKTPFTFTKVYDPAMPSTLPMPLFLRQLARHFARNVITWLRCVLVALVWLGWLPWCVRWMWRGWFWMSDGGWWALHATTTSPMPPVPTVMAETAAATQTSAAGGNGVLGYLSSPGLSAQMSPVNGAPAVPGPVMNITISPTPIPAAYPGGIFFEHNPFETLTQWPTVNRAIVDVLEGQLLTALIVVSFIIIFLIREWVVQQQPGGEGDDFDGLLIDDAPPADAAEDDPDGEEIPEDDEPVAVGHDVADEEDLVRAFGPIRAPHEAEDENAGAHAGEMVRPRRLARPRRRRAFGIEEAAEGHDATNERDTVQGEAAEDNGSSTTTTTVPLRPALTREATAQASSFRRDLEETNLRTGYTPSLDFGGAGRSTENLFQFGSSPNVDLSASRGIETPSGSSRLPRSPFFNADEAATSSKNRSSEEPPHKSSKQPALEAGASIGSPVLGPTSLAPSEELKPTIPPPDINEGSSTNSAASSWGAGSFEIVSPLPERVPSAHHQAKGKEIEPQEPVDGEKEGSVWESEDEEVDRQTGDSRAGPSGWSTTAQRGDASVASTSAPSLLDDSEQDRTEEARAHASSMLAAENVINEAIVHEAYRRAAAQRNIPEERLRATFNHLGGGQRVEDGPAPAQGADLADQGNMWNWVNGALPANPPAPAPEQPRPLPPLPQPDVNDREDPDLPLRDDMAGMGGNAAPLIPDDDAADEFEGIMELIGMRGPVMGLIQNAAISSMLITATVAIGVAFPYVVGKTVMMILAHPILFFFRFPMAAVSFGAEFIVDSATMTAFSMLLMIDQAIRFFIKPISFLMPRISKLAATSKVTSFLKDWAADGQNRVVAKFTSVETTYAAFRRYPPSAVPPVGVVARDAWERFSATCIALLHRTGLGALATAKLNAGPEQINFAGLKMPNPAVWAANVWSDTFSTVNFTHSISHADKVDSKVHREMIVADGIAVPLYKWSAWDRVAVVLLGYMFFTFVGMIYVRRRRITGVAREVERVAIEFLEQCGGVMKVVLIIGIEMFLFPLYCGILLDVAMLPLFEDATIARRVQFAIDNPITSIFVHWFIGTCYMFHFALFVSMCRKIMRTGVLYFIRDPDDPTFHPVRDVLDRPVVMQLRKIAFSGFIYGVLVLMCLGGVVWSLRASSNYILPIHWASHEPVLEFPIDLLFYNFLVPVAVKFFKPSDGLQSMYGWWFRHCARFLRLSSFMFGERNSDEEGYHHYPTWSSYFQSFFTGEKGDPEHVVRPTDTPPLGKPYFKRTGRFVRAPASDSLRRPKGSTVFIPVDEDNRRLDVDTSLDPPNGPTGADSPDWKLVYIPPYFRIRVGIVVIGIWIFAAITGVLATIGPLVLGRVVLRHYIPQQVTVNDIYAFSVGVYIFGGAAILISKAPTAASWIQDTMSPLFEQANTRTEAAATAAKVGVIRALKLLYLAATVGIVIPALIALVIEFYLVIPVHTVFSPSFIAATTAGYEAAPPPQPMPDSSVHIIGPASSSSPNASSTRFPASPPIPGPAHPFPSIGPAASATHPHTLHFVQDWTLGVLYLKMLFRLCMLNEASFPARTLRRVFPGDNYLNPDILLATKLVVGPAIAALAVALVLPMGVAWGLVRVLGLDGIGTEIGLQKEELRVLVYRMTYPGCLLVAGAVGGAWVLGMVVERWRGMVRDEVYLRGVRVHNHGERVRERGEKRANESVERLDGGGESAEGRRGFVAQGGREGARDMDGHGDEGVEVVAEVDDAILAAAAGVVGVA